MLRPSAFVGILALAACDQSLVPSAPTRHLAITAASDAAGDASTTTKINQTVDVAGTLDSPCTGEVIAFDGSAHIAMTLDESDAGVTLNYHLNTQNISGVGLTSGVKYNLNQVMNEAASALFIPTSQSGDVTVHYRIISQTGLDNFLADIVYTFTYPPLTITEKTNNVRCTG